MVERALVMSVLVLFGVAPSLFAQATGVINGRIVDQADGERGGRGAQTLGSSC
jgi:hypothetical protein